MTTLLCVKQSALVFLCLSFPSSKSSSLSLGKAAMILFLSWTYGTRASLWPFLLGLLCQLQQRAQPVKASAMPNRRQERGQRSRLPKMLSGGQVPSFLCACLQRLTCPHLIIGTAGEMLSNPTPLQRVGEGSYPIGMYILNS